MTLNDVLEITQKTTEIDGEKVYIIDRNMQKEMNELKRITMLHKGDYVFSMLDKHLDFILRHQDFAIAFRPIKRKYLIEWLPCVVYLFCKEWRRVSLQYTNCSKCNWKGIIANPTDTDLYITMESRFDILKKMYELPFLKCPLCGKEILGKAIWIDNQLVIG